jgi:uncharacterized protein YfiM (DUF2279 family)
MEEHMIVTWALVAALALPPNRWFAPDKVKHFFLAAFVQSVSYSALRLADVRHDEALVGATGITALAAIGKEAHDRRAGRGFSSRDLVWDAAGVAGASLLLRRSVR